MTPQQHLTLVLDDAEQIGPVELLSKEHGLITITYHETNAGAWFYSITHAKEVLFLLADEDVAIKRLSTLVSFRRGSL